MAGPPEQSVEGAASAKGPSTDVELTRAQQTTARRTAESKATIPTSLCRSMWTWTHALPCRQTYRRSRTAT